MKDNEARTPFRFIAALLAVFFWMILGLIAVNWLNGKPLPEETDMIYFSAMFAIALTCLAVVGHVSKDIFKSMTPLWLISWLHDDKNLK